MSSLAILGTGAWARALAHLAQRRGHATTLVGRNDTLPPTPDAVLVAIPTQALRDTLARHRPSAPLLLGCKGAELSTGRLPHEIAAETIPGCEAALITGPNFASEINAGLPAAAVIAASSPALRHRFQTLLAGEKIRLYTSPDPTGAALGGAAKNVIAIAAGAVLGAGYGENARAALITRGLAELTRLIIAEGGRPETAAGLSGLGDLLLTCTSHTSRNFAHGYAIARREPPPQATVEGIPTAQALLARAPNLDLPIIRAVADLTTGRITVAAAAAALLSRPQRDE